MKNLAIGTHLRKIRIRQNRTIQEIADKCKLSRSMISKIETNKVVPSVSTLVKLAKSLGTNVSALLEENGDLTSVLTHVLQRTPEGWRMLHEHFSTKLTPEFIAFQAGLQQAKQKAPGTSK